MSRPRILAVCLTLLLHSMNCAECCATVNSIKGAVFHAYEDESRDSISGAEVALYADNGNGVFDAADVRRISTNTNAAGEYLFTGLSSELGYFVGHTPSTNKTELMVSELIQPGEANIVIDDFNNQQITFVDHQHATAVSQSMDDDATILGHQRDIFVEHVSGLGETELSTRRYPQRAVAEFITTAGVIGRGVITWDGIDDSAYETPSMGLEGIDLTEGGDNSAFRVDLGIDPAGAGGVARLRVYGANSENYSETVIDLPVTDGVASETALVNFDRFTGLASLSSVDAIQLIIEPDRTSADGQIAAFEVVGSKRHDFVVAVPEPASLGLLVLGAFGLLATLRQRV